MVVDELFYKNVVNSVVHGALLLVDVYWFFLVPVDEFYYNIHAVFLFCGSSVYINIFIFILGK